MTDPEDTSGRRVLLVVAGVVVLVGAVVGGIVGANSAGSSVVLLDSVSVTASGPLLAAFGALLAAVAMAVLFGLAELAGTLEGDGF